MSTSDIIIDASIVAKWLLPDEQEAETALQIKQSFLNQIVVISVPSIIYYEVSNLLKSAVSTFRINRKQAIETYNAFLELDFGTYTSIEFLKETLEKSIKFDISSYDASYIALAELLNIPFYTADHKLVIQAKHKLVKDLKEYHLR